jgi:hypothetical protein
VRHWLQQVCFAPIL